MEINDHPTGSSAERRILTVSELTASIKHLLESRFPFVWISGEISNFRKPSSGHFYFTLRDDDAQISAVMFRNQARNLGFDLEDGMHILALGRISLYEPRGAYQIILEYIEPKGVGALQIAFEQLKERLNKEGLFIQDHKRKLPLIPKKINLITSPTGAVVHDMIHIIRRRYPNMPIRVYPVKVQGQGATAEICSAFEILNASDASAGTDIIILARGGGSLEDLQAFNSEEVARSVYNARVPVISAIGHETDFTISDFTADLRAPTPSAAAELAVPVKDELITSVSRFQNRLKQQMAHQLKNRRCDLEQLLKRLPTPQRKLQDLILRVDDYSNRITGSMKKIICNQNDRLNWMNDRLIAHNPKSVALRLTLNLNRLNNALQIKMVNILNERENRLLEGQTKLAALNPVSILKRGYSITRALPKGLIVRSPDDVEDDQLVDVRVADGSLICRVERKIPNGEKNI